MFALVSFALVSGVWAIECNSTPEGVWACPATGVLPNGGDGAARQWVDSHNKYRCMHNYPAVVWIPESKQKADCQHGSATELEHSTNADREYGDYSHGENLAGMWLTPSYTTSLWYNEVEKCSNWDVGCRGDPQTGHFTAMIWKGVIGIGCGTGRGGVSYCHYRAGKSESEIAAGSSSDHCYKANMGSDYSGMVSQAVGDSHSEETCERLVEACGDTSATGPTEQEDGTVDWSNKRHPSSYRGDSVCPTASSSAVGALQMKSLFLVLSLGAAQLLAL